MTRRKAWIWIALALLCAVGAGALSFYVLDQQAVAAQAAAAQAAPPTPVPVPTLRMPVAARDLPVGQALTADDIALKDFPTDLAPSSAITDTEALVGQMLAEPVAEGDIFRSKALRGAAGAPLSSSIEPGKTILAFPVVDLIGQTGLIVAGDRVDLLITTEVTGDAPGKKTGYTVQNVEVLRVLGAEPTEDNPNPKPSAFLLQLTPQDAVLVKMVKDSGGTIDLALRSPLDTGALQVAPATNVDLSNLLDGAPGR
jgi:pilus assembly protein CpaB